MRFTRRWHALMLVLFLGCSRGAAPVPADTPDDRHAISDKPVVYFEQNWSPDDSLAFYSLRQGSLIMRKELFDALEQPDSQQLFRDNDYLASFGFLPQGAHEKNPDGYPVGFVAAESLEINCGMPYVAAHVRRQGVPDRRQPGDDRRRDLAGQAGDGHAADARRRAELGIAHGQRADRFGPQHEVRPLRAARTGEPNPSASRATRCSSRSSGTTIAASATTTTTISARRRPRPQSGQRCKNTRPTASAASTRWARS